MSANDVPCPIVVAKFAVVCATALVSGSLFVYGHGVAGFAVAIPGAAFSWWLYCTEKRRGHMPRARLASSRIQAALRIAALVICVPVLVSGCSWLLTIDTRKAVKLAEIDIGRLHTVTGSVDLAPGKADLRFFIRDYDCRLLDVAIDIELRFADGTTKRHEVALDDLTWPRVGDDEECFPSGYLRDKDTWVRPLRFVVRRGGNPVEFSIRVTRAAKADERVHVWVVYNDRTPLDRMLSGD
jgi:hypothetical protein